MFKKIIKKPLKIFIRPGVNGLLKRPYVKISIAMSCTVAMAVIILFAPSHVKAQTAPENRSVVYCPYPLAEGALWNYDIYKNNIKSGKLKVSVLKIEQKNREDKNGDWYEKELVYVTMQFEDSYLNKTYNKYLRVDYYAYFLLNEKNRKYYPFIKRYISENTRIGDLMSLDIEKVKFKGNEYISVTLFHMTKDLYVEQYMEGIGLYYFRNGDLEYKLTDTNISELLNNIEVCVVPKQ